MAVAALAAVESLLSAKVADGMADTEAHDPNRELFGQGMANVAVSFFGGMPATGAIARTAVNVKAGGRTRAAAIIHGLVLAVIAVALAPALARIPLAALAGVLIVTAVRMVEFGTVRRILRSTRSDALLLAATAAATVAFNLVIAVGVGVALASLLALRAVAESTTFEQETIERVDVDDELEHALLHEHIVAYRLDGALFFGAAQRFLLELAEASDVEVVILRLGRLRVLDSTGAQALGDLITHLQHHDVTVLLDLRQRSTSSAAGAPRCAGCTTDPEPPDPDLRPGARARAQPLHSQQAVAAAGGLGSRRPGHCSARFRTPARSWKPAAAVASRSTPDAMPVVATSAVPDIVATSITGPTVSSQPTARYRMICTR